MSEKFRTGWRKVKDGIILGISLGIVFIPSLLLGIAFTIIMLLIKALITGVIASVCWNIAMTTMFGFSKVTLFQAFILVFTIDCLRKNYIYSAKAEYKKLKRKIFKKSKKEKMVKAVSIFITIIDKLITIIITVCVTMYSWNNIIPQLLNVELVQINFLQALAFAFLFNLLFRVSKSDGKSSKADKKNEDKEEQLKTKNDTVFEETTKAEDSISG